MTEESTLLDADRAVRARLRPGPCGRQAKFPLEPLRWKWSTCSLSRPPSVNQGIDCQSGCRCWAGLAAFLHGQKRWYRGNPVLCGGRVFCL